MGRKRHKLAYGLGDYVPTTVNLTQLKNEYESNEAEFDLSDEGMEQRRIEDNMEYEEMIVHILYNLEPREKLIFIFQILRDGGYQIDHASFAKAIHLSRSQYMKILDVVRTKSMLLLIGFQGSFDKEHKEK